MWYSLIELHRASLESRRLAIRASARLLKHPFNPAAYTFIGHSCSAACDAMDEAIGRYDPQAGIVELAKMREQMAARFYSPPTVEAKILPFARTGRLAS